MKIVIKNAETVTKPVMEINLSSNYFKQIKQNYKDAKENSCAKHRAMGFTRKTGWCPASCKFMQCGPCKTKNISCKSIMCDYPKNKGYYFSPHSLAILKVNLTYPERLSTIGFFFKSTKSILGFADFVIKRRIVNLFR